MSPLDKDPVSFPVKAVHILGFMGHKVSVATTQFLPKQPRTVHEQVGVAAFLHDTEIWVSHDFYTSWNIPLVILSQIFKNKKPFLACGPETTGSGQDMACEPQLANLCSRSVAFVLSWPWL